MAKNLLKTKAKDPTDAVFGVNQEGDCVHKSLAEMVHTLIAGTTGSGKSVKESFRAGGIHDSFS